MTELTLVKILTQATLIVGVITMVTLGYFRYHIVAGPKVEMRYPKLKIGQIAFWFAAFATMLVLFRERGEFAAKTNVVLIAILAAVAFVMMSSLLWAGLQSVFQVVAWCRKRYLDRKVERAKQHQIKDTSRYIRITIGPPKDFFEAEEDGLKPLPDNIASKVMQDFS